MIEIEEEERISIKEIHGKAELPYYFDLNRYNLFCDLMLKFDEDLSLSKEDEC